MKKVAITQDLCRMVELMLKGGAQQKEVGERLGISKATVSRIKTARFDVNRYKRDTDERRIIEKNRKADKEIQEIVKAMEQNGPMRIEKVEVLERIPEEEQVPGQICMDLQPAEEQKPEMSDQTKLMRFLAGKFNEVDTTVQVTQAEILLHIGKIEDYLAQILRKMDG